MRILVTGAAGFLGGETVRRALARGHVVRAMVRTLDERRFLAERDVVAIDLAQLTTDCRQPATGNRQLSLAVSGIDAVIHCAAVTSTGATDEALSRRVNVQAARMLFEAARAAGASRWIQISSMSAHSASTSAYGRTKLAFDDYLRAQAPPPAWTILRPSLIYGLGGGLVAKTLSLMKKLPFIPVVGSGRELLRPVYVGDVAGLALDCLENDNAAGKSYTIGGADEVTLNEFMEALARASGLRRRLLHLPLPLCLLLARVAAKLVKNPPLTVDNVLGVRQVQRVEQQAAEADLGYRPLGLEEGLRRMRD